MKYLPLDIKQATIATKSFFKIYVYLGLVSIEKIFVLTP